MQQPHSPPAPRLLDQLANALHTRHHVAEDCHVEWAERFIRFNRLRHPAALGTADVGRFLTHLAVEENEA